MKAFAIGICTIVVLFVVALLAAAGWWSSTYNGLVARGEAVGASWGQVENVYQRRADLVPNLVAAVKGYAAHESGTLERVIAARREVADLRVDGRALASDPDAQRRFAEAQQGLTQALSGLRVTVERYPDLKANEGFLALQSQLEGTENRIAVERRSNQIAVESYNRAAKGFLSGIVAAHYGYAPKPYFAAAAGASSAPAVSFDK